MNPKSFQVLEAIWALDEYSATWSSGLLCYLIRFFVLQLHPDLDQEKYWRMIFLLQFCIYLYLSWLFSKLPSQDLNLGKGWRRWGFEVMSRQWLNPRYRGKMILNPFQYILLPLAAHLEWIEQVLQWYDLVLDISKQVAFWMELCLTFSTLREVSHLQVVAHCTNLWNELEHPSTYSGRRI